MGKGLSDRAGQPRYDWPPGWATWPLRQVGNGWLLYTNDGPNLPRRILAWTPDA